MPIVKGIHFPYTKQGIDAAKKAASKVGSAIKNVFGSKTYTYTRKPSPNGKVPPAKSPSSGTGGDSGTFGPAMKQLPSSYFKKMMSSDGYMKK